MSAVRMCDKCGAIFPEGQEGSAILQGAMMVRDERTGRVRQEQTNQDACAECASGRAPRPRLALGSDATKSQIGSDSGILATTTDRTRSTVMDTSDGPAAYYPTGHNHD